MGQFKVPGTMVIQGHGMSGGDGYRGKPAVI